MFGIAKHFTTSRSSLELWRFYPVRGFVNITLAMVVNGFLFVPIAVLSHLQTIASAQSAASGSGGLSWSNIAISIGSIIIVIVSTDLFCAAIATLAEPKQGDLFSVTAACK